MIFRRPTPILEERDAVLVMQFHNRLLPRPGVPDRHFVSTRLADASLSSYVDNSHIPQLLNGCLDVRLRRLRMHLERVRIQLLRQMRPLLSDQRAQDHLMRFKRNATDKKRTHLITRSGLQASRPRIRFISPTVITRCR